MTTVLISVLALGWLSAVLSALMLTLPTETVKLPTKPFQA